MIYLVRGNIKLVDQSGAYIGDFNPLITTCPPYRSEFAYDSNGLLTFLGKAQPSSLTSATVWQIRNLIYNVNSLLVQILYADGNQNFDNIWDNRVSLPYS